MSERWKDWLTQAERDLEHAAMAAEQGFYEWACFSAQQAAEKALKAVYLFRNAEAWGHSVASLLKNLPEKASEDLIEKGAKLDRFYLPTRYANSFESGAPMEYFFKTDAEEAIENAKEIIRYGKGLLPK